jgi:flagellar protein FlbD
MAEVIEKIATYRARVIALAHDLPAAGPRPVPAPALDQAEGGVRAVPLRATKK